MGLSILKGQVNIDFIGHRRWGYAISAICILLCIFSILFIGIKYGVDFAGGAAVQLQFQKPIGDETIKTTFAKMNMPGLAVQQFGETGTNYLLRFSTPDNTPTEVIRNEVEKTLATISDNPAEIQRLETVGPKVGADLRNSALSAIFYALLLIMVYISGRFEQRWVIAAIMAAVLGGVMYAMGLLGIPMNIRVIVCLVASLLVCAKLKLNFAVGAVVGLVHDVIVTVGVLVITGKEFDLNVIAALLTLVGYSLNDTIIIYDRIREHLEEVDPQKQLPPLGNIINYAINRTLGRTIMTSLTTLAACISLFVWGGGVIHDFALTMLVGVVVGTFSTIFVCSPILIHMGNTEQYVRANMARQSAKYVRPDEHGVV